MSDVTANKMICTNTELRLESEVLAKPTARQSRFLDAMSKFGPPSKQGNTKSEHAKTTKMGQMIGNELTEFLSADATQVSGHLNDEQRTSQTPPACADSQLDGGSPNVRGAIEAFDKLSRTSEILFDQKRKYRNSILDFSTLASMRKDWTSNEFSDDVELPIRPASLSSIPIPKRGDSLDNKRVSPTSYFSLPEPGASLKVDPIGSLEVAFKDVYILYDVINEGAFGVVYKAQHKSKKVPVDVVAVKIVNRKGAERDKAILNEAIILNQFRGFKNIITLIDLYKDDEKIYIVQELARGGDVFDRLVQKETYTESDARDLAKTLCLAVKSLHERNLIHRDLKPENLLLSRMNSDSAILLCDFGCAKFLPYEGGLKTNCGTPAFMSPEMVRGIEYQKEVDMWSVGCILFMLLEGYQPFLGDDDDETYELITTADYDFEDPNWDPVSKAAKDLISNLLILDRKQRLTVSQALQSDWLSNSERSELMLNDLTQSLHGMRHYCENIRPQHDNCWRYEEDHISKLPVPSYSFEETEEPVDVTPQVLAEEALTLAEDALAEAAVAGEDFAAASFEEENTMSAGGMSELKQRKSGAFKWHMDRVHFRPVVKYYEEDENPL